MFILASVFYPDKINKMFILLLLSASQNKQNVYEAHGGAGGLRQAERSGGRKNALLRRKRTCSHGSLTRIRERRREKKRQKREPGQGAEAFKKGGEN